MAAYVLLFMLMSFICVSYSKILLLPLTHSISKSQFNNTHHLLKSTATNSAARFHHHRHHHVSLPLSPGSDYTLSFTLASKTISLYMDTGSDVVWLPCSPFTCILCEGKYNPNPSILNLSSSASPVACHSEACSSIHSHLPKSDLCAIANCPLDSIEMTECNNFPCPNFYYAYGDGSLIGKLYTDDLQISPSVITKNFTFGCSHTALAEPMGVAGFGRGLLSLPSQLSTTQFSYCLNSHSFNTSSTSSPSPLILGKYEKRDNEENIDDFVYTPLLHNPKYPHFYCVGLEGVSIGKHRMIAGRSLKRVDRAGNGGMVVDSGTTYTILPVELYKLVANEFDRRVKTVHKRASDVEGRTGMGPCYYMNGSGGVPVMVFHFTGNSSLVMPRRNYFYEFLDGGDDGESNTKVGCLMVMNGGDFPESGGPVGLLGNYQQQGFEVVYDLLNGRVGFAKRKCASLWDGLNQD